MIGMKKARKSSRSLRRIQNGSARAFNSLWKAVSSLNVGPVRRLTAVPRRVLGPLTVLFKSGKKAVEDEDGKSSAETPPTRDELAIPSVSELIFSWSEIRSHRGRPYQDSLRQEDGDALSSQSEARNQHRSDSQKSGGVFCSVYDCNRWFGDF
ncbi:hypothetical protein KI387_042926 [Taxus chinensis]|uniref:Uncharacterized protein n=1 Tax=Taxus chinensis TaxID=29808 RepID=A0AA38C2P4_TAXCH|nr:hypothetical protein KI387_042926 [Taxus chinensis]